MAKTTTRILVIDDEKPVCISCKRVLEEDGHHVDYVLTGTEGAERAVAGDYRLVLLDLKMPDLAGMEVFDRIKARRPDLLVIIITGYATIQTSIECIKKGAVDYIPKPFTPEELTLAVDKALDTDRLREENAFLKSRLVPGNETIVGRSEVMLDVIKQIEKIAPTDFSVLLHGESGTGKELVAKAIHVASARRDRPFVAVDISSLTPTLVESELFGHVRGAFTGATQTRPGYFALAHGGTLFLDEIANIPYELQGKLLRVLETRRVTPIGGQQERAIDIRLVCATNRDLAALVEAGTFREDLFYRINVIPILLPPLRERAADIPLLATHFLESAKRKSAARIDGFTTEAMAKIVAYGWPGNVRELKNIVERIVATVDGPRIEVRHLPPEITGRAPAVSPAEEIPKNVEELKEAKRAVRELAYERIEQQFLLRALKEAGGNVTRAAELTGMQRTNFHALMRKYGLRAGEIGGS
ncbi:MAG: sigma-54 dependent transcriptional regulator [Deltaproteobacteria bacterium]|nr:sigma-54 dependent transcriptional regulator [Deltaproteobacteria bacterium]